MIRLSFHFVTFLITIEKAWLYIFRFFCFIPMKNFPIKRKNSNKKLVQYYTGTTPHTPQHVKYMPEVYW